MANKELDELHIDESYIQSILKRIVEEHHTHPQKKDVRVKSGGGFQISCPYCGDSEKNPNNYRGNLNKLLFYKCFNDGCDRQTHFTQMCRDFKIEIDGDTKKEIYAYLDRHASSIETLNDEIMDNGLKYLIDLEELLDCVNNNKCESELSDMKPIEKGSAQFYYLMENRKLTDPRLWKNIYQANFHITGDWIEKVIVYINRKKNKIVGAQVRNLKEDNRRLFHIYTFEDLYNWVGKEELSEGQFMMYNKLSYYYGILNVDFEKTVTIFEGYGDALLWPNSIGVAGLNTDMKFLEENGLDIRYFFDNDSGGYLKTEEKVKLGFPCFLWEKMFEWIVEKKGSDDPYYHYHKVSKVKDLTKLNSIVPEAYKKFEMENFFSQDVYDLKYVPKVEKKWNKNWKKEWK